LAADLVGGPVRTIVLLWTGSGDATGTGVGDDVDDLAAFAARTHPGCREHSTTR
jgi:hypothetical protein